MKVSEIKIGMKVNIPTTKLNGKDNINYSTVIKRNVNPFLYVVGFENSIYGKRGVILNYRPDDRDGDYFFASDLTPYEETRVLTTRPTVGSKVMVRPDLECRSYSNGITAVNSMMAYKGKIATVTSHHSTDRSIVFLDIDGGIWNWDYDMLVIASQEIEYYECTKAFPGVKVGDKLLPTSHPAEYFDPEYFNPVYKNQIPEIRFEGYTIGISGDQTMVNWGCKGFTKKEIKSVIDFVSAFNEMDLHIGLRYVEGNFTQIDVSQLKELYKILK